MGCDIHLHTEVKINGKWHHYGSPSVDKNYCVFAKMANIQNYDDTEPLSEPRGMPSNATELTKFDCDRWGSAGHSHSWLNAEEIVALEKFIDNISKSSWYNDNFGYFFGNDWGDFLRCRNDLNSGIPKEVEDVRFVFWFDS